MTTLVEVQYFNKVSIMPTLLDIQYFNKGFKIETHRFNRQQKHTTTEKNIKGIKQSKKVWIFGEGRGYHISLLFVNVSGYCVQLCCPSRPQPFFCFRGSVEGGGGG